MKKKISLLLTFMALAACGGGGGGGSPTAPQEQLLSGNVVDGYLSNAVVFWDCNANGVLDVNEDSTRSGASGTYQIRARPSANCSLLATIDASTTDEDAPYTLQKQYVMSAVPDAPSLITPFTTAVAGRLKSNPSQTVAQAEFSVATALGLTTPILLNYQLDRSGRGNTLRIFATSLAGKLVTSQATRTFEQSVTSFLSEFVAESSASGASQYLAAGIRPFELTYANVAQTRANAVLAVGTLRVTRSLNSTDASVNQQLEALAGVLNSRTAAQFGTIDWSVLTADELKQAFRLVQRATSTTSNSAYATQLAELNRLRTLAFADARSSLNANIDDETGFMNVWGYFSDNPRAALDLGVEFTEISAKTSIAILRVQTGLPNPPAFSVLPSSWTSKQEGARKLLSALGTLSSALACKSKMDALTALTGATADRAPAAREVIVECANVVLDLLTDAKRTSKTHAIDPNSLSRTALRAADTTRTAFDSMGPDAQYVEVWKFYNQAFGTILELVDLLAVDPVAVRVSSLVSIALQYSKAYVSGLELALKFSQRTDVGAAAAYAKYDADTSALNSTYYIAALSLLDSIVFSIQNNGTQFRDDFNGTALDTGKWIVGALNGSLATYTQSNGFLNIVVAGGSCGWCGASDGAKFTPRVDPLDGDFEVILSAEEVERLSRDSTRPLSAVSLLLTGSAAELGIYIIGDVTSNQGTVGHQIITYYRVGSTVTYPSTRNLPVNQYYAFQFRIRRVNGVSSLAYKIAQDTAWTELTVPTSFPSTVALIPSILVASGDGGRTQANSSFKVKFDTVTIRR